MALLSTLTDQFPGTAIDTGKWTATVGVTVAGDKATLGGPDLAGSLRSVNHYEFDRLYARLAVPVGGSAMLVVQSWSAEDEYGNNTAAFEVNREPGSNTLRYSWHWAGAYHTFAMGYVPAAHAWLSIELVLVGAEHKLLFCASADGVLWTPLFDHTSEAGDIALGQVKVSIGGVESVGLRCVNAADAGGPDPDPDPDPDPEPGPDDYLDTPPYDTGDDLPHDILDLPAKPEPACATLLDLIREFSAATRRAVRITGPNTIAMVDPVAPLPAGWTQADAAGAYHATSRQLVAGASVLSLSRGDLALTGNAALVADDVRLVVSGWQVPDRLPVYGLHPAPVQRVTYTFTPQGFSAQVEFAFHTVPLEVRRT